MNPSIDLDVVRLAALRWPLLSLLDPVATEKNPVMRCLIVAKLLGQVKADAELAVPATRAIEVLRAEAMRRHQAAEAGPASMPALTPTVAPATAAKERHGA